MMQELPQNWTMPEGMDTLFFDSLLIRILRGIGSSNDETGWSGDGLNLDICTINRRDWAIETTLLHFKAKQKI